MTLRRLRNNCLAGDRLFLDLRALGDLDFRRAVVCNSGTASLSCICAFRLPVAGARLSNFAYWGGVSRTAGRWQTTTSRRSRRSTWFSASCKRGRRHQKNHRCGFRRPHREAPVFSFCGDATFFLNTCYKGGGMGFLILGIKMQSESSNSSAHLMKPDCLRLCCSTISATA